MGAPEVMEAERTSSVPSWTARGTGVKVLGGRLATVFILSMHGVQRGTHEVALSWATS